MQIILEYNWSKVGTYFLLQIYPSAEALHELKSVLSQLSSHNFPVLKKLYKLSDDFIKTLKVRLYGPTKLKNICYIL